MPVLIPDNKYSCRINAALNFAQTNANADLDALADVACLSKYHFSRLFHNHIGESPVGFLKRVRLERAACLLAYAHNRSILDIASHCGFSTSQHFTRAFSEKFNRCPRDYRSFRRFDSKENVDSLLNRFEDHGVAYDKYVSPEQVNIVKMPPIRIAYVRNIGQYYGGDDNVGIREAFEHLIHWARKQEVLAADTKIMGVSWDYSSITPDTMCRYDACIQIPESFTTASNISTQRLPGGFYATMRTTYEYEENFFLKWKLFNLILISSPKFKQFQTESITGPWVEIYPPITPGEEPEIVICSYLQPRTETIRYSH